MSALSVGDRDHQAAADEQAAASRASGGAGAVAWTAIASKGARSGRPALAVADEHLDVRDPERGEQLAGGLGELVDALDR